MCSEKVLGVSWANDLRSAKDLAATVQSLTPCVTWRFCSGLRSLVFVVVVLTSEPVHWSMSSLDVREAFAKGGKGGGNGGGNGDWRAATETATETVMAMERAVVPAPLTTARVATPAGREWKGRGERRHGQGGSGIGVGGSVGASALDGRTGSRGSAATPGNAASTRSAAGTSSGGATSIGFGLAPR